MKIGAQHLLSVSRVLLGAVVLFALLQADRSWLVLPAVLSACTADVCDGILARHLGRESELGRLIDNLSDACFLALAFWGFAAASTWSHPATGNAARYWAYVNWLPVVGLALSFGTYLLQRGFAVRSGTTWRRSLRGHHAGILNYGLAVVGGVAVIPDARIPAWVLEPLSVAVALFNVTVAIDSLAFIVADRMRPS